MWLQKFQKNIHAQLKLLFDRLFPSERWRLYLLLLVFNSMLFFILGLSILREQDRIEIEKLVTVQQELVVEVTRLVSEQLVCSAGCAGTATAWADNNEELPPPEITIITNTPIRPIGTQTISAPTPLTPQPADTSTPAVLTPSPTIGITLTPTPTFSTTVTGTPSLTVTSVATTPAPATVTAEPTEEQATTEPPIFTTVTPTPTIVTITPSVTITGTDTPDSGIPTAGFSPVITTVLPAQIYQGTATVVTITGKNFVAGERTQVLVGGFSSENGMIAIQSITPTSITIQISADFPVGTYDVTVVNPDQQSGTAESALRVNAPIATNTGLNYLAVVGTEAGSIITSDRMHEHVQVLFISIPESTSGDIYLSLFDPYVSIAGNVVDEERDNNILTEFTILGAGAFDIYQPGTEPPAGINDPNIDALLTSGAVLDSRGNFNYQLIQEDDWNPVNNLGPFQAAQGDIDPFDVQRRLFTIVVRGTQGSDTNWYNVRLVTDAGPIVDQVTFAYYWVYNLPNQGQTDVRARNGYHPYAYPFIDTRLVDTISLHNCGVGYQDSGFLAFRAPSRELIIDGTDELSGIGECQAADFSLGAEDFQPTDLGHNWTIDFTAVDFKDTQGLSATTSTIVLWLTADNNRLLPIYTRPFQ